MRMVMFLVVLLLAMIVFWWSFVQIAERLSPRQPHKKAVDGGQSRAIPERIKPTAKINCASATDRAPRVVQMKVTAYCLCERCCGKWALRQAQGKSASKERRTSIGDNAKIYDGVAADPKLLPYRTHLKIPGIGIKEVDDTGGGMRQSAKQSIYHIDVRMPSHQQAREWGVQWLDVEVLGS